MNYDYVYVSNRHRVFNPKASDYIILSKYIRMMHDLHGLEYDSLAPFDVLAGYSCFKVIDKGKSLLFCLNNSEHIVKPEKIKNNLLAFSNHNPTGI
jgi:hypothetical protein